jgi:hypothetical protein
MASENYYLRLPLLAGYLKKKEYAYPEEIVSGRQTFSFDF